MDIVRIGIIGVGNMGSTHAKSLWDKKVKNAVLSAICDSNPERIAWAKAEFPGVAVFSDATSMFKSNTIDAVIVATPHYDHPILAMEALDNKLHVMCEKPAGVFTKNVRMMNAKAAEMAKDGIVFAMMFNQRTNCVYRKMREMVQNNELGDIKRTNWIITNWYRCQYYYDSGNWRASWAGEGGGVLLNQCPHNLDLWQWICGMPAKVTAFCHEGKWHDIEVEDDVTAYVEYANGATGVFVTCTADAPGTNRFEITGDKGRLICENDKLIFDQLVMPERELNATSQKAFVKPEYKTIEVQTDGKNPQHNGVLTAFVANILTGEPLVASGEEGILGLTLSNAMHLSSWLHKTIELPLDEELYWSELQKKVKESKWKKKTVNSKIEDLSNTYNN